jgi:hypothetical protein
VIRLPEDDVLPFQRFFQEQQADKGKAFAGLTEAWGFWTSACESKLSQYERFPEGVG